MKKILFLILICLTGVAHAQLNNSWIDYNKTYYKFKLNRNVVCRISGNTLNTLGLANVPAEQFQLWRNGAQVRLYTSSPTGILGANGYIEFWGMMNDGLPDLELYKEPSMKLCNAYSIHSDTSTYFLTVNPAGNNLRFTDVSNNVAGNVLPADAYYMRTVEHAYREYYNRGFAQNAGEYIYSSTYEQGEGFSTYDIHNDMKLDDVFRSLNVYTAGPANSASFKIAAFGNAAAANTYYRSLHAETGSTVLIDSSMDGFKTIIKQVNNLPLSIFTNTDSLHIIVSGTNTDTHDRIVLGSMSIQFPSTFNFNNESNFSFELGASSAGNFLVIDNFNYGSAPPVLLSLNDGNRYTGDISIAGKVRFALPPSNNPNRKFLLINSMAINRIDITAITPKTFVNFGQAANQGDYLIISSPVLYNDGSGNNYVDQYRQYRSTIAGGSFTPKVYNIDELTDQFAFGIFKHPAAIRDFIRFANQNFSVKPKYAFIIGRGMSSIDYKMNETAVDVNQLDLVPSYGWPASDVLLACDPNTNVPLVPIGRLGAVTPVEVKYYLDKVKEYELAQTNPSQTINDKLWMKDAIFVSGGKDPGEDASFLTYLNGYNTILSDTNFGAHVETFRKLSSSAVQQLSGQRIDELVNQGVSVIQYFGHSSANTLAFNLNSPEIYTNQGKYSFFCVSGCSAGNYYIYDPARLTGNLTLSEKWVLENQKGSIGFLASSHLGIPPNLDTYNSELYNSISKTMYGNTIGNQIRNVLNNLGSNPGGLDFFTRLHLEEINLQGDPAIHINHFAKPDFTVEDQTVKITPSIISVADANFNLNVKIYNIGKAYKDSVKVYITHTLPNNAQVIIYNKKIKCPAYEDSLNFVLPINALTDKGLNKITVSIDPDNLIDELNESNNIVTKQFYIFEDELRPVYPYNFSIINNQGISFTASTANPLVTQRQYVMEIDTTELFNSPFKKQYTQTGNGGAITFTPSNLTFTDSTVYYWRTSITPLGSSTPIWNNSSFVYLVSGGTGFNQSHYFQHLKSGYSNSISLGGDRKFHFNDVVKTLTIKTGLYPYYNFDEIDVYLDFDELEFYGCTYNALQFMVYDSVTLKPWRNFNTGNNGRFGSAPVCQLNPDGGRNFFEFPYFDAAYRKKAMDFMDSIPDGAYVSITNLGWTANTSFINDWKNDTTTLGSGHSIYHKLKSIGFSSLDSFTHNLPFMYFYKKNRPDFNPIQVMGPTETSQIVQPIALVSKYRTGVISSPLYGPAAAWNSLHWRGSSQDVNVTDDTTSVEVYGVTSSGTETLQAVVNPARDTSIAFISAATYPYLRLKMNNADFNNATPYQLRYWRVNADYLPEGAIAPNILFNMKDTLEQGENINFSIAFKNISSVAFADSLKIRFVITDNNNVQHVLNIPRKKALVSGDTLVVSYLIDTRNFSGKNTLYLMVNDNGAQPEQFLFNNILYKDFFVKQDKVNPLLDVTFDGVHILNQDIVSAKANITIKLKDENKFLALADTSLLTVQVKFPPLPGQIDGDIHTYHFGDAMQFIPANLANGENSATINLKGDFNLDGEYQLIVTGKDVVGNVAGNAEHIEYKISFTVENRPMISNMLNYPNPFTTSTAFVFTLTGSEVPQNIRIQIMTITGKIVREITKQELGSIHIGNNITEFKWDGTDMYGQKLANGVYLYRVITSLNGQKMNKYNGINSSGNVVIDGLSGSSSIDQYFNKGYGKMYLMR